MPQFYMMKCVEFAKCRTCGLVELDDVQIAATSDDDVVQVYASSREEAVQIFTALLEVDLESEETQCASKLE